MAPKFNYFQPPLRMSDGQVLSEAEHLPFLLGFVVTRKTSRDATTGEPFVPAQTVRDFVRAYYMDCAGDAGLDYRTDPFFHRMMEALDGKDNLPLVDFDCLAQSK